MKRAALLLGSSKILAYAQDARLPVIRFETSIVARYCFVDARIGGDASVAFEMPVA